MRTISAVDDLLDGFAVVDGLEATRQRVIQHLRFTLSEWFLDSDQGIPYFDGLFAGGSSPELAAQLIVAEVLGVEDVTDVAVVRAALDPLTRRLSLEFRVSTVHGQVTVAEVL